MSTFFDPLLWYVAGAAMHGYGYGDGHSYGYSVGAGDGSDWGYVLYPGDSECNGVGCGTLQLYGSPRGSFWGNGDMYGTADEATGVGHFDYSSGLDVYTF